MMYQDKFVVVVKVNGKVLREQGDIVQLPFGAEYSILLKNLSTKRAVAKIEIDGREVTGGGLVIDANSDAELERFIDMGDLKKGYRFKYIQKTKEVQDFRGDKIDDGFIRVEWQYEKEHPIVQWANNFTLRSSGIRKGVFGSSAGDSYSFGPTITCNANNVSRGSAGTYMCSMGDVGSSVEKAASELNDSPLKDEGITVEGSDSNQSFRTVSVGEMETEKHVIVLKLVGATVDKKPIQKPIYVKTTVRCKQCGTVHSTAATFCSHCSARLVK